MKNNKKYLIMSRFSILLIFVATLTYNIKPVLIVYVSVLVHELAHLLVCAKLGIPTQSITILPYGMELKHSSIPRPKEQIKISVAGPLSNLLIFFVGFIFLKSGIVNEEISFITSSNLLLFMFNLIPCMPLDGGEILKSILSSHFGILNSFKITDVFTKFFGVLFLVFGSILFLNSIYNFSLLIIAFIVFKKRLSDKNKKIYVIKSILNGDIVSSSKRTKVLYVSPITPLYKTLYHISFDYSIIIKSDCGISLSQKELLEAIKKNSLLTVMDILK